LRALVTDGRVSVATPSVPDLFVTSSAVSDEIVPVAALRFPAALAAATALSECPLLGRFLAPRTEVDPFTLPRSAVRFRKGLGRFSSSARSYSGDGWDRGIWSVTERAAVVVVEWRCGCGRGFGWTWDVEDEEVPVTDTLVGSETEEGREPGLFSTGRPEDVRIEGLRSRVGGALAEVVDVDVEDPESDELFLARLAFSLSFLELGLGGGLRCSFRIGTPAGRPL
jgi:hypothetical protein